MEVEVGEGLGAEVEADEGRNCQGLIVSMGEVE